MPCYQCSRCNKCGMLSTRMELTCATCGEVVVPGTEACPNCNTSYLNNIARGYMKRINSDTGEAEPFDPLKDDE